MPTHLVLLFPLTFQRFVTFEVFTETFDFWLLKRWLYGVVLFSFKNISVGGNVSLLTHLKVSSLKPYSKVRVDKHLSWLCVILNQLDCFLDLK